MKWSVTYLDGAKGDFVTETVEAYSFKQEQDKVTFFDGEGKAIAFLSGVTKVLKQED